MLDQSRLLSEQDYGPFLEVATLTEEDGEDSPMALSVFVIDETTGDLAVLTEAQAKATSVSFEY